MHNFAWVALLRQIPEEQQNKYMLVTTSGQEIALQQLLRIEDEFVALKGRLSGSQEAGRLFFVPYANIDYFGSQLPVKESDFHEVFGSLVVPKTASLPPLEEESFEPPSSPQRPTCDARPVIRSEVLERFRSRPSSSAILPDPKGNGR